MLSSNNLTFKLNFWLKTNLFIVILFMFLLQRKELSVNFVVIITNVLKKVQNSYNILKYILMTK